MTLSIKCLQIRLNPKDIRFTVTENKENRYFCLMNLGSFSILALINNFYDYCQLLYCPAEEQSEGICCSCRACVFVCVLLYSREVV